MDALKTILLLLIVAYSLLAIYALLFANRQVFPVPPVSYPDDDSLERVAWNNEGDTVVTRVEEGTNGRLVLVHHGNGVDIGTSGMRIQMFKDLGYSVLVWDYPGYGHSSGLPTERAVLQAAEAVYRHAVDTLGFDPSNIVHFGHSLGGGPALHLARRFPSGAVIVECTFTSIFRTVTSIRLLPWDMFPSIDNVRAIQAPLLVIHGTEDRTIPFSHGAKLHEFAPEPKAFLWVDGAGHNDVAEVAGETYQAAVRQFLETHLTSDSRSSNHSEEGVIP